MCADMIDLKKVRTRIKELEEELKATHEDYEEEIEVEEWRSDQKDWNIYGRPYTSRRRRKPKEIRPEDYIIIDDTDSDPDDSDDDYVDEAGADIMESATEEYF